LSAIEQMLTLEERQRIEARLANYNIPLQILQMVAEQCGGSLDTSVAGKGQARQPKLPLLLARLNDQAILMLQQIFLDCHDIHSGFRLAVFLSSKHGPMNHKFVMDEKIAGVSGSKYSFDVCIYNRLTGELKAVAMQNNSTGQKASDNRAISEFLHAIEDVALAHRSLYSAYYSSSYGYENASSIKKNSKSRNNDEGKKLEIKFLEYNDKMYFENKPLSERFAT
jgi:hypothetical protein